MNIHTKSHILRTATGNLNVSNFVSLLSAVCLPFCFFLHMWCRKVEGLSVSVSHQWLISHIAYHIEWGRQRDSCGQRSPSSSTGYPSALHANHQLPSRYFQLSLSSRKQLKFASAPEASSPCTSAVWHSRSLLETQGDRNNIDHLALSARKMRLNKVTRRATQLPE